ncbi:MAG TPA: peptidoglycan-binding domain-containing protein [Dongiaceae bacterium]
MLALECQRRRKELDDEIRERIAGMLAVGLVIGAPLCYVLTGTDFSFPDVSLPDVSLADVSLPDVSLVEQSEAAEPSAGSPAFEAPRLNPAAVMTRLEADKLPSADVRSIQTRLKDKGFNPGPIDGIAGKRTLSALNRYRQSIHLPPAQAVSRDSAAALLAP